VKSRQRSVPRHYGSKDNPPTGSAVSISHISQSNTIVTAADRAIMRINKGATGLPPCQVFPDKDDLRSTTERKAKLGKRQKRRRMAQQRLGVSARPQRKAPPAACSQAGRSDCLGYVTRRAGHDYPSNRIVAPGGAGVTAAVRHRDYRQCMHGTKKAPLAQRG
jgi:hypothetical protein